MSVILRFCTSSHTTGDKGGLKWGTGDKALGGGVLHKTGTELQADKGAR